MFHAIFNFTNANHHRYHPSATAFRLFGCGKTRDALRHSIQRSESCHPHAPPRGIVRFIGTVFNPRRLQTSLAVTGIWSRLHKRTVVYMAGLVGGWLQHADQPGRHRRYRRVGLFDCR